MHFGRWLWGLDTRILELLIGFELLRRGLLWVSGLAPMDAETYRPMTDVMGFVGWGLFFLSVAIVQIAGITINGNWRRSPHLRQSALLISIVAYILLAQVFAAGSNAGVAIQTSTQQYLSAFACFWCFLNITSKLGHHA